MSAPSGRRQPAGQRRQSLPCRSASAAYVAKSVSACPSPAQNHSKPASPWKPANSASSASCLRRKIASRSMCRSPFSAVPALVRRSRSVGRQRRPPGQLLDAQEQRIAIAPARRVIRARFDRGDRRRRGQRIDHQHAARPGCASSGASRAQIRQVADSPARRASAPHRAGPRIPRREDRRAGEQRPGLTTSSVSPPPRGYRRWYPNGSSCGSAPSSGRELPSSSTRSAAPSSARGRRPAAGRARRRARPAAARRFRARRPWPLAAPRALRATNRASRRARRDSCRRFRSGRSPSGGRGMIP